MICLLMLFSGIVQLQNVQCYAHYFIWPIELSGIRTNKGIHQPLVRKPRQTISGNGRPLNDERIMFPNDDNEDTARFQNTGIGFQNNARGSWNNVRRFQNENRNSQNRAQWFQNGGPSSQNGDQLFKDDRAREVEWLQNGRRNFQSQNDGGFWLTTTTPNPPTTTIAIPGSATKRSTCEDQCRVTMQYDPVCGTNSVTYTNIEWYKCALKCGKRVGIKAHRACPRF